MRTTVIATLLALTALSACARKETETVVISEPVSVEPTYTGKYK